MIHSLVTSSCTWLLERIARITHFLSCAFIRVNSFHFNLKLFIRTTQSLKGGVVLQFYQSQNQLNPQSKLIECFVNDTIHQRKNWILECDLIFFFSHTRFIPSISGERSRAGVKTSTSWWRSWRWAQRLVNEFLRPPKVLLLSPWAQNLPEIHLHRPYAGDLLQIAPRSGNFLIK